MIYTWLFARLLDWRTYAVTAMAGLLCTLTYKVEQYGYQRGAAQSSGTISALNKQINDGRDLYAQSVLDSSKIQTEWQAKVDNATQDANNAKVKLETISGDNQRLNDSLRSVTSKANQRISLPDTPKTNITEYTTALSTVFNECTSEYLKLAELAQSDAIDAKQVIDSYPQSK